MPRWLLPESIADVLPSEARAIEDLRRRLLDLYRSHGYEMVMPPLVEYLDSLLTGSGRDLELKTFKLVDQISGRSMGLRADITPQVARIDAHLLNRAGVTRLCYCGSVVHTLASGLTATREPLQLGAELYGHAGLEADEEILRLLALSLDLAGVSATRIDLGHIGVFKALAGRGGLDSELEEDLFDALQAKDLPSLRELTAGIADPVRSAILALPDCYGGAEVLERAARLLPADAEILAALDDLQRLAEALRDLPLSFDLADLRGYHYHSGVVFAAYCDRHAGAIALGGRYDKVGKSFGRGRPATGFSMDLREIARIAPNGGAARSILAPAGGDGALQQRIAALRQTGERVVIELPGHDGTWAETGCDRRLILRDGEWQIVPLQGA